MNKAGWRRSLSVRIPSPPPEPTGSAHVSIELLEMPLGSVLIQADCTNPPWEEREMLYCGPTSTNKHLYTMLYESVDVSLVHFRMRSGSVQILEEDFYEQGERWCRRR